jgi:hypothetical protein
LRVRQDDGLKPLLGQMMDVKPDSRIVDPKQGMPPAGVDPAARLGDLGARGERFLKNPRRAAGMGEGRPWPPHGEPRLHHRGDRGEGWLAHRATTRR